MFVKLVHKMLCRVPLTEEQLRCLEEINIGMLASAIRLFYDWIEDGFCDFSEVDFVFKTPLSLEAEKELMQLASFSEENTDGLLANVAVAHEYALCKL